MEICPEEMHALATMAKMEKTCPKVSYEKYSYEEAKRE